MGGTEERYRKRETTRSRKIKIYRKGNRKRGTRETNKGSRAAGTEGG